MNPRLPFGGERWIVAQHRDGGIGHGDRADVPRLVLQSEHGESGTGNMRPGTRVGPGKTVYAVFDGQAHQVMPRRVILNFVPAVAVAIMGVQHRRVFVGKHGPLICFRAAGCAAELFECGARPTGALARRGIAQGTIGGERVVGAQRRRLVENLMVHGRTFKGKLKHALPYRL
jgi:hypothetical protein